MPEPVAVMQALSNEEGVVFLDSSSSGYGLGRYSIFACDPVRTFEFDDGRSRIIEGEKETILQGDCFDLLREFSKTSIGEVDAKLPFLGGAIGYLSYDLAWEYEQLPNRLVSDHPIPMARFGFYDTALIYDHQLDAFFGVSIGDEQKLDELSDKARRKVSARESFSVSGLKSNFDRASFLHAVERVRSYILEGEIYQANFAQRFDADFSGSAWSLYEQLRESNPAPYAAYLKFGDDAVLSSSPERFLKVVGREVVTRPIKGTRPRGRDEADDLIEEEALRGSEKDRAELLMIVDLERNDLGKTCKPGSVEASELFALERYARVIHQTANVSGRIDEGKDVFDCLRGLFPGGSITGAPKIRAMEVIEELERHKRGIYTGSIGYVSCDGNADFNIAIRTMRQVGDNLIFHAGGGIVWDSVPEIEYEETLHKARAMMEAIGVEETDTL